MIFTGSPDPGHGASRATPNRKESAMKLLFAVRNKVSARKSLKASAWYIWY
ncbi:tryptorubin family RiPP precursor [Streptomyces andamanensis]|uniref:Tryptorubin family RiPP n=1 Tax=Streptomyces andamanensis TaxID=1565035 RepID=A0ABV8TIE0_9ACTN|nr:tryptorubin family RiPP precursor [Streptomyces sp. Tu 6176]